jgi:hypothetical protein
MTEDKRPADLNLQIFYPEDDGHPYLMSLDNEESMTIRFTAGVNLPKLLATMSVAYDLLNNLEDLTDMAKSHKIFRETEYGEILLEDIEECLSKLEEREQKWSKTLKF